MRSAGAETCNTDVVCFVDGDSSDFGARMPCGLIGAVALDGYDFAKGTYRRPFAEGDQQPRPTGGGRVTELTAKPLLPGYSLSLNASPNLWLARSRHVRNSWSVPIATRYSVDVALLIDVWRRVGLDRMAEVDLDIRQNRHRSLGELG